jgi:hypothetical protein
MTRLNRPQVEALRRAIGDEAWAGAIRASLDQAGGPELRKADAARAQRLLDDALTIRETIGFIDPSVYSEMPARRRRAALHAQATRLAFFALENDRCASVRAAVCKARALREARFPAPGGVVKYRDTEGSEIPDPMAFVTG